MRRFIAGILALAFVCARPATAGEEHLVSPARIEAEVLAAGRARTGDLARVDALLARAEVERAAARVGLDVARVRSLLPHLDDAELHDLAMRTQALHADPVAGTSTVPIYSNWYLLLVLVVVVALLAGAVLGIKALVD